MARARGRAAPDLHGADCRRRGRLEAFAAGPWGTQFPTIVASWRRAWAPVIPFVAFPPDIRRVLYTTNAREHVNRQLRKTLKTRGHCPSDEAATKLIWILYEDRFTRPPA